MTHASLVHGEDNPLGWGSGRAAECVDKTMSLAERYRLRISDVTQTAQWFRQGQVTGRHGEGMALRRCTPGQSDPRIVGSLSPPKKRPDMGLDGTPHPCQTGQRLLGKRAIEATLPSPYSVPSTNRPAAGKKRLLRFGQEMLAWHTPNQHTATQSILSAPVHS